MKVDAIPTTGHVESLLARGEVLAARGELDVIAGAVRDQARLAHEVAQLYMRLGESSLAAAFYRRAVALDPKRTAYRYNLSTALIALGQMEEAEALLDAVIAADPEDFDAWYNRATLRRQTSRRNHVAALEQALQKPGLRNQELAPLGHALAKELEDLGRYRESFEALRRGAGARRAMLSYRVEDDEAIMRGLAGAFTRAWMQKPAQGCDDPRPVFVVGLPRSGTTLVDRMLSSHSRIDSHGESSDFALSLMQLAGQCKSKEALLERATQLDPEALGAACVHRLAAHDGERVVDKTPANFLYLGLIAKALPAARIIHVRRQPMDVCYAIHKTLFRMAYPYSYDLDDLGRYWLAFDALMRHWQEVLPQGRLLTIDYEVLVTEPEKTIRAMLGHIGMPWEDACLHFDRNPLPSLTASAAQVRQPIYTSSVGKWRHHAQGLEPLARRLREAGIPIDAEMTA